jgi:hypothetical protein
MAPHRANSKSVAAGRCMHGKHYRGKSLRLPREQETAGGIPPAVFMYARSVLPQSGGLFGFQRYQRIHFRRPSSRTKDRRKTGSEQNENNGH